MKLVMKLTPIDVDIKEFLNKKYFDNQTFISPQNIITSRDLSSLRQVVSEKRAQRGNAPIGTDVFQLIREQAPNIHFVLEDFSDDVDAMLIVPYPESAFSVIILNQKRPLANQIFAAAHEYYHYLVDLPQVRVAPSYCNLAKQDSKREKLASRFAAEFLLPSQALCSEINTYEREQRLSVRSASPGDVGLLAFIISLRYGLPFKAALLRLVEEGYAKPELVQDDNLYGNLRKIQQLMLDKVSARYKHIRMPGNPYVTDLLPVYLNIAFEKGLAGYDEILRDSRTAGLSDDILPQEENYEDDDDFIAPQIQ